MQAFGLAPLPCLLRPQNPSFHISPTCASKPPTSSANSKKSRKPRPKRPRSKENNSGFGIPDAAPSNAMPPPVQSEKPKEEVSSKIARLQKLDSNGISMEHRLREEIQHPLRKPKQTLFATLSISATLGFFFAIGRFAVEKDPALQVAKNVAIDVSAIVIFGYLTWREFEFGRRSLNSMAGRPQARDLPVVPLKPSTTFYIPFAKGTQTERLSAMVSRSDVLIVAGRRSDTLSYLGRCQTDGNMENMGIALVVFATDMRGGSAEESFVGVDAVASAETENTADWIAWIGDAIPPRKNVGLFRIDKEDKGLESANAYVVAVDVPSALPLPDSAKRPEVVEI